MTRTIITVSDEEKSWLDSYSHQNRQSLAQTIRDAVHFFREHFNKGTRKKFLKQTAGIWSDRKLDSLKEVERLRSEWEK